MFYLQKDRFQSNNTWPSINQRLVLNQPEQKWSTWKPFRWKKQGIGKNRMCFPNVANLWKRRSLPIQHEVGIMQFIALMFPSWLRNGDMKTKWKGQKKNDKQWNMCFVQFCCHQDRNIADKVCTRKTITDFSAIINVGRLHKSCKETCHSIFSEKNCKYWQGIYSNFGILYSSWLWAARS